MPVGRARPHRSNYMLKRSLAVAVAALAISIPAIATGATTTKHKAKAHAVNLTAVLTNLKPPGAIVTSGTQSYTGSADGTVSGAAIHGALRGTNIYTAANFTGTTTVFG